MTTDRITDEDLARIEVKVADPNETGLTPYWRITVPALVAQLREAREALETRRQLIQVAWELLEPMGRLAEFFPPPESSMREVGVNWAIANLRRAATWSRRAARIADGLPAEEQPGEWELHLETSHPDG